VSRKQTEFLAADALAFFDAFRFGLRMPAEDLVAHIRQEEEKGTLGPAALVGLQFALVKIRTEASPAVVRFSREVPDEVPAPGLEASRA